MTQTFDPFADVPSPSSSEGGNGYARTGAGDSWTPPEEGLPEQLLRILRRRKWVVLQALVLIPLIAFLYSKHEPTQYTANAGLLFGNPTQSVITGAASAANADDPTVLGATNSSLISLPAVSTYASRQTGGKISAAEIQSSTTASTGSNGSNVATISATSSSPQRAAAIANAYGTGYIAFRRYYDQAAYTASINQIQAELAKMTPAQVNGTQGRRLSSELANLQNVQALDQGEAQLVQPATPPSSPSSPKTTRNVVIGVFVGLVLGLLIAALLERLDRRVSDQDEFARLYGLPVLAEIPRVRELGRGEITFETAERFRALRTSLRYLSFDSRMHSLLIASPLPEDGKSTVARLLAQTMAAMGDRVVLVELDLHKPSSAGGEERGLSTVLIGDSLDDALLTEDLPVLLSDGSRQLTVLPAGPSPPNPSQLIDSARMREVLSELERRFDVVVLDAPALASVSDGLALIPAVSSILIVAGLGHTTIKSAVDLRQQIAMLRGRPVGIVVNFTRRQRHGKYHYSYEH
jgi:capsular exopolysaccharide synthesis family protein